MEHADTVDHDETLLGIIDQRPPGRDRPELHPVTWHVHGPYVWWWELSVVVQPRNRRGGHRDEQRCYAKPRSPLYFAHLPVYVTSNRPVATQCSFSGAVAWKCWIP